MNKIYDCLEFQWISVHGTDLPEEHTCAQKFNIFSIENKGQFDVISMVVYPGKSDDHNRPMETMLVMIKWK